MLQANSARPKDPIISASPAGASCPPILECGGLPSLFQRTLTAIAVAPLFHTTLRRLARPSRCCGLLRIDFNPQFLRRQQAQQRAEHARLPAFA